MKQSLLLVDKKAINTTIKTIKEIANELQEVLKD